MIPMEDWMELTLWEPQKAKLDVRIALPDTVDPTKDESAIYRVASVGSGYYLPSGNVVPPEVTVGDLVIMYGMGSIATFNMPNGERKIVGRARDVAFVVNERELMKEEER